MSCALTSVTVRSYYTASLSKRQQQLLRFNLLHRPAVGNRWSSPARPVLCCSSSSGSEQPQQHTSRRRRPRKLTDDDPLALAYLGDAIWSLYVRNHFLSPPKHFRLYQSTVKPFITAEGQAKAYDALLSQQLLSQAEQEYLQFVYSWRRMKFRKRFSTPAAEGVYRKATALEALVGYLHLHDPDRLHVIVMALLPPAASAARSSDAVSDQSLSEQQDV